ncbi:MAG TPA: sigma-54 dependent transcriptional regulator [Polyangiales bacterium]
MAEALKQVLIADDEANLRRVLTAQLARDGYEVHAVEDGEAALEVLAEHHIDLVITDLRMPKLDGMALLKRIVADYPDLPVVMITAHGTVDTAVEALKCGAFDYVTKPFDRAELQRVISKATKTHELSGQLYLGGSQDERGRFQLIGQSAAMREVYQVIERVADTPSTVLITGESGTGKELIARALHEHSERKERPFIRVNCAALPPELIESELFGYEKGAFTGAVTSKPGRFELADTGTLFLDEIAEIPASIQVKLLRAIQESEFERVGGIKTIAVDVRLIAATNRSLPEEIARGHFREDLYYRLNVVHIQLPPLRERPDDLPLLVDHFLRRFNARLRKNVAGIQESALALLRAHEFRGNIRELENAMERCVLFCNSDRIGPEDLPPEIRAARGPRELRVAPMALARDPQQPEPASLPLDSLESEGGLKEAVREATNRVEKELILRALKQTANNVTHAARMLKISRKGLQLKMKEHGLREDS